jgi:hypothetical protein
VGPVTAKAIHGVARFAGLGINGVNGASYTITYAASSLTADSQTVGVTTGAARAPSVVQGPPASVVGGAPMTPAPSVQLVDSSGNPVSTPGVIVTVALTPGSATVQGATAITDANGVATFTGLTVLGDAGTYGLVFSSPGLNSPPAQSFSVSAQPQTVTFAQPANVNFGAPVQQLAATASSGLPVTYALGGGTTNGACAVTSSGAVTILAVGTCQVRASQAGNARYAAAPDVTQSFNVVAVKAGIPMITSVSGSSTAVTVAFTPPGFDGGATISDYQIEYRLSGGSSWTTFARAASTTTTVTVTGLTNDSAYVFRVAAVNSAGAGTPSPVSASVTPTARALAVQDLSATPGDQQVTINWTAPQIPGGRTITSYEVFVVPSGGTF